MKILFLSIAALCFISFNIYAGELAIPLEAIPSSEEDIKPFDYWQLLVFYQHLSESTMREAYSFSGGFLFQGIKDISFEDYESLFRYIDAFRFEIGLIAAGGQAIKMNQDWNVEGDTLWAVAVPINVSIVTYLRDKQEHSLIPYLGCGAGGIFGFERIGMHVSMGEGFDEVHYAWHDTCYRQAFSAHVFAGITARVKGSFVLLMEVRFTQAGRGSIKRAKFGDRELQEGWGQVFEDFQHSNFCFSGFSANLGFGASW